MGFAYVCTNDGCHNPASAVHGEWRCEPCVAGVGVVPGPGIMQAAKERAAAEHVARVMVGLWNLPESVTLTVIPGCPCHRVPAFTPVPWAWAELTRGVDDTWEGALEAALLWVGNTRDPMYQGLLKSHAEPLPPEGHRCTIYPHRSHNGRGLVVKVVRHNVQEVPA